MTNSIFIKQSDKNIPEKKLTLEEFKKIIPKSYSNKKNDKLRNHMTEWRWRIYNINNKKYTEISMMEPKKKRLYLNKYKKWTEENIEPIYDKYIIQEYYYYSIS